MQGFQGSPVRFSHNEVQGDGAGSHTGNSIQQPGQPGTGPWPLAPRFQGWLIDIDHHDAIGDAGAGGIGDDGVGQFGLDACNPT